MPGDCIPKKDSENKEGQQILRKNCVATGVPRVMYKLRIIDFITTVEMDCEHKRCSDVTWDARHRQLG